VEPKPHQNFYPEPEHNAAPQHNVTTELVVLLKSIILLFLHKIYVKLWPLIMNPFITKSINILDLCINLYHCRGLLN
jgi:hypothetical protein